MQPPRPLTSELFAGEDLRLETMVVEADVAVLEAMHRAMAQLQREAFHPARFLLGTRAFLTLYALLEDDRQRRSYVVRNIIRADFYDDGPEPEVFGIPCSLDPAKPENWVQCLPRATIRNGTYSAWPPNFGVSRGHVATEPDDIKRIITEATPERKLIIPDDAAAELAKTIAVTTSYWDRPYPTKPDKPWTGTERKK
jgi:hypothetical protein